MKDEKRGIYSSHDATGFHERERERENSLCRLCYDNLDEHDENEKVFLAKRRGQKRGGGGGRRGEKEGEIGLHGGFQPALFPP